MSLLDVNVKSLTSKLRIASSGRKVQVQGEFGFFFWRVFCLRGSVLCLQVFLCDGMQKTRGRAQLGREGLPRTRISIPSAHSARAPPSSGSRSPVALPAC